MSGPIRKPSKQTKQAARRLRIAARNFVQALDRMIDGIDEETELEVAMKNNALEEAAREFVHFEDSDPVVTP